MTTAHIPIIWTDSSIHDLVVDTAKATLHVQLSPVPATLVRLPLVEVLGDAPDDAFQVLQRTPNGNPLYVMCSFQESTGFEYFTAPHVDARETRPRQRALHGIPTKGAEYRIPLLAPDVGQSLTGASAVKAAHTRYFGKRDAFAVPHAHGLVRLAVSVLQEQRESLEAAADPEAYLRRSIENRGSGYCTRFDTTSFAF